MTLGHAAGSGRPAQLRQSAERSSVSISVAAVENARSSCDRILRLTQLAGQTRSVLVVGAEVREDVPAELGPLHLLVRRGERVEGGARAGRRPGCLSGENSSPTGTSSTASQRRVVVEPEARPRCGVCRQEVDLGRTLHVRLDHLGKRDSGRTADHLVLRRNDRREGRSVGLDLRLLLACNGARRDRHRRRLIGANRGRGRRPRRGLSRRWFSWRSWRCRRPRRRPLLDRVHLANGEGRRR